jgi:hypothetical protein
MALVCPNVAEIIVLKYIVGLLDSSQPVMHLYGVEHVPSDSTVLANLTEVSTTTGYAPITLFSNQWSVSPNQGGTVGNTTAVYSEQTFRFTTGVSVYGYYITNHTGDLMWVERFSGAPFTIPDGGGTISIAPRLTLN